jgi:hypothetical protein
VFYQGEWHGITKNRDNNTNSAVVWVWRGHVQLKPDAFY